MSPEEKLVKEIEKVLNLLVNTCEKVADEYGSKSFPIATMKQFRDKIVKTYREGLKENPNFNK